MHLRGDVIENYILELLLMNKKLSIKEIHLALKNQYNYKLSLSQLYKIIQKLTKEYVLVKKHNVLMLNAWWIRQITKDVENLGCLIKQIGNIDFIKHGTTQYYYASTLNEREVIWIDLASKILTQQKPEDLFFYDSHLYYLLGMKDLGTQEYDDYLSSHGKIYYLLGNTSLLDNYTIKLVKDKKIDFKISLQSSFMKEGYSLRILGDYVLEAFIPNDLAPFFENIYMNTTTIESFDIEIFRYVFDIKTETTLRITHDKYLADSLRKNIKKEFKIYIKDNI